MSKKRIKFAIALDRIQIIASKILNIDVNLIQCESNLYKDLGFDSLKMSNFLKEIKEDNVLNCDLNNEAPIQFSFVRRVEELLELIIEVKNGTRLLVV